MLIRFCFGSHTVPSLSFVLTAEGNQFFGYDSSATSPSIRPSLFLHAPYPCYASSVTSAPTLIPYHGLYRSAPCQLFILF